MLAAVDYCWLLMVATGCSWLLLVAAGCSMIAGCGWDTTDCYWLLLVAAGCCWLLLVAAGCWMMLVAAGIRLAGGKVFEYFRDIDDLRLRHFCRRKKLWIISGYWWFAAKENLQEKKSLSIFVTVMRKFGLDNFWKCPRIFSVEGGRIVLSLAGIKT